MRNRIKFITAIFAGLISINAAASDSFNLPEETQITKTQEEFDSTKFREENAEYCDLATLRKRYPELCELINTFFEQKKQLDPRVSQDYEKKLLEETNTKSFNIRHEFDAKLLLEHGQEAKNDFIEFLCDIMTQSMNAVDILNAADLLFIIDPKRADRDFNPERIIQEGITWI